MRFALIINTKITIMNDELQLIKTLAHESEKVNTKDSFFLPALKQGQQDHDVTGWNNSKTQTLATLFPLPSLQTNFTLRQSHNLNELLKIKLSRSPESFLRFKLRNEKSNSLCLSRATIYKVSTISFSNNFTSTVSKSVDRKPILPRIQRSSIISIYLPKRRSKKIYAPKQAHFAEVGDLLVLLKPEIRNPIQTRVTSNLRSKNNLNKSLSKRQLSKGPATFGLSTSQNNDYLHV